MKIDLVQKYQKLVTIIIMSANSTEELLVRDVMPAVEIGFITPLPVDYFRDS